MIIEKTRAEEASDRKRSGLYNCAQAVACTYADVTGLDVETIKAATSAFGTGMGSMDGTCGALVGAGIVIGMKIADRIKSRSAMKCMMTRFKEANSTTVCRQLKGIDTGVVLRDCNQCVADASRLLEDELNKM
ncbi:MAG: C-GCAxxG-C-C family protein [Bacteroides sp.]|nr:C-GCAxxG-C-C family protein [Bacteroides sp.]MCM1412819.1 C-GCAxxG-C-C family protein [Bacteroides sp.]MCM1471488.1 C-GCAxxG-C-C family protein [Bacteroides sp.]